MYDAKLLSECAGILTGKQITVRMRPPCLIGAAGVALTDKKTGAHFIDLDPAQEPAQLLSCFLHEVAHHKLGHPSPGGFVDQAPRSISARVTSYSASLKDREDAAGAQALTWSKYAEDNAPRFRGDWMAVRLKALELMRLQPMIDAAVKLAVNRALAKRQAQQEILSRKAR